MTLLNKMLCLLLLATTTAVSAEPVFKTGSFLSSPSYFNGFENIPSDGTYYTGGTLPYAEGGITVTQFQADPGNSIWVTLGADGERSWYPNGGDNGYTGIQLTSGADFSEISFLFSSFEGGSLQYSLLNDGVQVLGGVYTVNEGELARAGFSGGGFDQLLLRSGTQGIFGDGRPQALLLDSIGANAVGVPEPGSLALLGVAMGTLLARRRKWSK